MLRLARRGLAPPRCDDVQQVANADDLRAARAQVDATEVTDEVVGYVVALVRRTRELPERRRSAPARAPRSTCSARPRPPRGWRAAPT